MGSGVGFLRWSHPCSIIKTPPPTPKWWLCPDRRKADASSCSGGVATGSCCQISLGNSKAGSEAEGKWPTLWSMKESWFGCSSDSYCAIHFACQFGTQALCLETSHIDSYWKKLTKFRKIQTGVWLVGFIRPTSNSPSFGAAFYKTEPLICEGQHSLLLVG